MEGGNSIQRAMVLNLRTTFLLLFKSKKKTANRYPRPWSEVAGQKGSTGFLRECGLAVSAGVKKKTRRTVEGGACDQTPALGDLSGEGNLYLIAQKKKRKRRSGT